MRRNGFTLLEILVALVVLGFLLAGLSQGVRFGLQAWSVQTRRVGQQADMDAVDRTLRRLLAQADPGEAGQPPAFAGTAHTLAFNAMLPVTADSSGVREADIGLGVDAGHRLVLRISAHPHAEWLGPPTAARVVVLLDQVDHIDLSYFRGGDRSPGWAGLWADQTLPALVRLRIAFPKDDRRHWPDVLAEPMRVQPGQ